MSFPFRMLRMFSSSPKTNPPAVQAAPQKEPLMGTVPAIIPPAEPAKPTTTKETAQQKFENILNGIGKFIQDKIINPEINIATSIGGKALIDQFLPVGLSQAIDNAEEIALNTYLQIEAEEQSIAKSTAPYATKVAQVLVLQGSAIAKILASAGLATNQATLTAVVQGATYFTQIPLTNLSTLQAPAASTTTAQASS